VDSKPAPLKSRVRDPVFTKEFVRGLVQNEFTHLTKSVWSIYPMPQAKTGHVVEVIGLA